MGDSAPAGRRLLLVDDDPLLRQSLVEQLKLEEGLITTEAESGKAALAAIGAQEFDLILLDVSLGDIDGRELCRRIRSEGNSAPIIMFTETDSDAVTIRDLGIGANECVVKPIRFGTLLALIRAQLRTLDQAETALISVGPYDFHPAAQQLIHVATRKKIRLTEKETSILNYLYCAGVVVGREELLAQVWGYNSGVTTHTLETHVYRLRQKMETNPTHATILITAQNGYQLIF